MATMALCAAVLGESVYELGGRVMSKDGPPYEIVLGTSEGRTGRDWEAK
jgi:hypothetical protein